MQYKDFPALQCRESGLFYSFYQQYCSYLCCIALHELHQSESLRWASGDKRSISDSVCYKKLVAESNSLPINKDAISP